MFRVKDQKWCIFCRNHNVGFWSLTFSQAKGVWYGPGLKKPAAEATPSSLPTPVVELVSLQWAGSAGSCMEHYFRYCTLTLCFWDTPRGVCVFPALLAREFGSMAASKVNLLYWVLTPQIPFSNKPKNRTAIPWRHGRFQDRGKKSTRWAGTFCGARNERVFKMEGKIRNGRSLGSAGGNLSMCQPEHAPTRACANLSMRQWPKQEPIEKHEKAQASIATTQKME